jgi:hypothetical protein
MIPPSQTLAYTPPVSKEGGAAMAQSKKKSPIDERLTLAEVRARIGEIKPVKTIEAKSGGAVRSGQNSKAGGRKAQR